MEIKGGEKQSLPTGILGLGMGLPNLTSKKKEENHASEALEKLREQTREAVLGLESTAKAGASLGDDSLGKDGDMESMVETMMQQLLSKEILHEPMKEIGERYPKWLEEHKSELSNEDYGRYSHQSALIKELNEVYDNEPNNFHKIVDLMQKMQECGQPPSDIVQELAPDLDLTNFGQL
ncbi:hypothetical protein GIB67_036489 [Kingdonia uniflora]|uniref:Uncharacterized protein n=1 Tax=Kingdonia uniflora TaxID=39325 RepID=A0A7J7P898_9MAGN|nr:hypothetical protein GIB67_036489 [Kingdonia uniflora]